MQAGSLPLGGAAPVAQLPQGGGWETAPSSLDFPSFLSITSASYNLFMWYASPLHVLSTLHVSIATQPLAASESSEPPSE